MTTKPPDLVRTQAGRMIHRGDCRFARNGTPWRWAEGRNWIELAGVAVLEGYRTCRKCDPLGIKLVGP